MLTRSSPGNKWGTILRGGSSFSHFWRVFCVTSQICATRHLKLLYARHVVFNVGRPEPATTMLVFRRRVMCLLHFYRIVESKLDAGGLSSFNFYRRRLAWRLAIHPERRTGWRRSLSFGITSAWFINCSDVGGRFGASLPHELRQIVLECSRK